MPQMGLDAFCVLLENLEENHFSTPSKFLSLGSWPACSLLVRFPITRPLSLLLAISLFKTLVIILGPFKKPALKPDDQQI